MTNEQTRDGAYAIFRSGGKQYTVQAGAVVQVEKLGGEAGDAVSFDEVLLTRDDSGAVTVGSPTVSGAVVKGKIVETSKDRKRLIFKKKRRQGWKLRKGHRQTLTTVQIESVN